MSPKEILIGFYKTHISGLVSDPCKDTQDAPIWMVDTNKIYHIYKDGAGYCSTANKSNAEYLATLLEEHSRLGSKMTPEEIASQKRMAAIRNLDFQLDTVKTLIICLLGIVVGKLM